MKIKKYQSPLALKPTQFAVGLLEVEFKTLHIKKLRKKKLKEFIEDNPVPVIISPWKELCVIDHHHLLFALWHSNIKKVRVKVIKDYSGKKLSYHRFWQMLARENHAYLYDQFGNGPQQPLYLPPDIRGMADDPYRSLAWMVRKEGGYENSKETFAEFKWADFFRSKKLLESHGRRGFHPAVIKGLRMSRSKAASGLPGFIDAKKIKKHIEKSEFVPKARKKGEIATKPVIKT